MSNITLTRRQNALALFQSYAETMLASGASPKGMEQAFAATLEISPSMWSQIKSSRPIGDKLARQIEQHCKKPQGWLDEPHALTKASGKSVAKKLCTQLVTSHLASKKALRQRPEHHIEPAVQREITAQLRHIEAKHKVRILYACESGSRGWGFPSPDSDYDVRFIYVHTLPWYLQLSAQPDVVELPISDDLDINGWELRKALGLLKKGNATLVEWLDSPVIYQADATFLDSMLSAVKQVYRPERGFQHYLHMARNNDRAYLHGDSVRLKKYLYVLRPLLAALWLERGLGQPPMRFEELVDTLVGKPALRKAIDKLLVAKKKAKEADTAKPIPAIRDFIDMELARLADVTLPAKKPDFALLDHLLMQTVLTQELRAEVETGYAPSLPSWIGERPLGRMLCGAA